MTSGLQHNHHLATVAAVQQSPQDATFSGYAVKHISSEKSEVPYFKSMENFATFVEIPSLIQVWMHQGFKFAFWNHCGLCRILALAEEILHEFLGKATGTIVDWVQMHGMKVRFNHTIANTKNTHICTYTLDIYMHILVMWMHDCIYTYIRYMYACILYTHMIHADILAYMHVCIDSYVNTHIHTYLPYTSDEYKF